MALAQFEELKMSEIETIFEFHETVDMITNEAINPQKNSLSFVKSLVLFPYRFRLKKIAILEVQNLNQIRLAKLVGKLKTYEMKLNMEENDSKKLKNIAFHVVQESLKKSRDKSSAIEDEMTLFVRKFGRILQDKGSFDREDGLARERKFRPSGVWSSERNEDEKSYPRESWKSSNPPKCFTSGGIRHYAVDCANNQEKYPKGKNKVMKVSWSESESDVSQGEESLSDDDNHHISFIASVKMDSKEFEYDPNDQSYGVLGRKYDSLFNETYTLNEEKFKLEASHNVLQKEVLTLNETKKELSDK